MNKKIRLVHSIHFKIPMLFIFLSVGIPAIDRGLFYP